MSVKIYAHRGASLRYPENTLEAISEAIRLGADGVELDVQRTADGQLVVIHDEELTRLTGSPGFVKDFTLAELRTKNVGHYRGENGSVPTLEEVLDLFRHNDLEINLELKNSLYPLPELEDDILRQVAEFGLESRVIYSSFNHLSVKQFVEKGVGDRTGILFSEWLYRPWEYAKTLGAAALHPSYNVLQYPDLVRVCRENGIAIRTWTVDLPEHMDLVLALSPDAMITNDPALAMERRAALEGMHET